MQTRQDVVNRLQPLQREHHRWIHTIREPDPENPNATVNPKLFDERGNRMVANEIVDQVLILDKYTRDEEFKPEAYSLVLAIDDMLDAWAQWAENVQFSKHEPNNPAAHPEAPAAWKAWNHVLAAVKPFDYPKPESIGQLLEEKLSLAAIADIYGWYNPDGSADIAKVEREKRNPGSEYEPETWISPEIARKLAKDTQRWHRRRRKNLNPNLFVSQERSKKEWAEPAPAPESFEMLARLPSMTYAQLARMKDMPIEDVVKKCSQIGIALSHGQIFEQAPELDTPVNRALPIGDLQEQLDRKNRQERSQVNAHTDKGDLTSQVIAIVNDNPEIDSGSIYQLVIQSQPGATVEVIDMIRDSFEDLRNNMRNVVPSQKRPDKAPEETGDRDPSVWSQLDTMTRKEVYDMAKQEELDVNWQMTNEQLKTMLHDHFVAKAKSTA